jgi:hypothetical protein
VADGETIDILAVDAEAARTTGTPGFGVTRTGFVAKPFARILAEKLAVARSLFGDDVDLSSGSVLRKIFEVTALEDARTWATLGATYDSMFVVSATGDALSRLGAELGLPRPHLEAQGTLKLDLTGTLPPGFTQIHLPRGARLSTSGGHHVALDEPLVLSKESPQREVPISAFYPGPEHNLDPSISGSGGGNPQKIDRWVRTQSLLSELVAAETAAGAELVTIIHGQKLTGGERTWPDARYRELLLRAPRSVWTVEAIRTAVSLVPGVRQVQVRDAWGGLDLHQSIFGNFNFIERVFSSERDLASPYYFTVLVAPTPSAIWSGADGLETSIANVLEDLRPIGIFPRIEQADEIAVGVEADLVVRGVPLPSGSRDTVNASEAARTLKARLVQRLRRYVENLGFGEPVRAAEVVWTLMNEPGIVDVRELRLVRFPPSLDAFDFGSITEEASIQRFECGKNIDLQANQIPVLVDDPSRMVIV